MRSGVWGTEGDFWPSAFSSCLNRDSPLLPNPQLAALGGGEALLELFSGNGKGVKGPCITKEHSAGAARFRCVQSVISQQFLSAPLMAQRNVRILTPRPLGREHLCAAMGDAISCWWRERERGERKLGRVTSGSLPLL